MTNSTYDYVFSCEALQNQLQGQHILVTQWQGTEAVSQLYRFEVTVALRSPDLALEKLLNQPATLRLRKPDGQAVRWHGIVTQCAQCGHDETYDYYQLVLEPRLSRLRLHTWSDIYLNKRLDELIVSLLEQAGLEEAYQDDDTPYDYRIKVPGEDLSMMWREFACQFEESCLNFLMRKLEFYGVYFWFEQGEQCESIVFGNAASQQPPDAEHAIYYPKGALDPDARHVVLSRMNRQVSMQPAKVRLHALHEPHNTLREMRSDAAVLTPEGQGTYQSVADYFSEIEEESSQNGIGSRKVPGSLLAQWRAQEIACRGQFVQGEAQTPGVLAGRFIAVSEYQRLSSTMQYYVLSVEHEGAQVLDTSVATEEPSYRARFTALPRWRNQAEQSDAFQFRPSCSTPVPRITRLMSGFVDRDQDNDTRRFAQPDDRGRYQVNLSFVRKRYGGYRNSAWLRMSTPYAAGAARKDLRKAGMHFPLREGTEVLISFLNGDPDLPVIVGTLPNDEAPSVVRRDNARQHILSTPAGNSLIMEDGKSTAGDPETSGDGAKNSNDEQGNKSENYVRLFTPYQNSLLSLGQVPAASENGISPEEAAGLKEGDGVVLRTDDHAQIWAGKSMLIEVPGHYRVCAGSETSLDRFLGSESSWAPGVTAAHSGGVVFENFTGAKFELSESAVTSLTLGLKAETFIGGSFEGMIGFGATASFAGTKEFNPREKKVILNEEDVTGLYRKVTVFSNSETTIKQDFKTATYDGVAYESYQVKSPYIDLNALGSHYGFTTSLIETLVTGFDVDIKSDYTSTLQSNLTTTVKAGETSLTLRPTAATLDSKGLFNLKVVGQARINGQLICLG